MTWTNMQKMARIYILSSGLFVWKHKNIYAFKDRKSIQEFLHLPEKFNERLKPFYITLGNMSSSGNGITLVDINIHFLISTGKCYVEIKGD